MTTTKIKSLVLTMALSEMRAYPTKCFQIGYNAVQLVDDDTCAVFMGDRTLETFQGRGLSTDMKIWAADTIHERVPAVKEGMATYSRPKGSDKAVKVVAYDKRFNIAARKVCMQ